MLLSEFLSSCSDNLLEQINAEQRFLKLEKKFYNSLLLAENIRISQHLNQNNDAISSKIIAHLIAIESICLDKILLEIKISNNFNSNFFISSHCFALSDWNQYSTESSKNWQLKIYEHLREII